MHNKAPATYQEKKSQIKGVLADVARKVETSGIAVGGRTYFVGKRAHMEATLLLHAHADRLVAHVSSSPGRSSHMMHVEYGLISLGVAYSSNITAYTRLGGTMTQYSQKDVLDKFQDHVFEVLCADDSQVALHRAGGTVSFKELSLLKDALEKAIRP